MLKFPGIQDLLGFAAAHTMKHTWTLTVAALVLWMAGAWTGRAAEARLANGRPIPGEIVQATEEGLRIESAKGKTRTYPWRVLSAATRYRHESGYREKFNRILQRETPPAPTNRVEELQRSRP